MSDTKTLLARKLAGSALTDAKLAELTAVVERSPFPVIDIDICTHGYCTDLTYAGQVQDLDLSRLMEIAIGPVRKIEIFPNGIPLQDHTRIRLTSAG